MNAYRYATLTATLILTLATAGCGGGGGGLPEGETGTVQGTITYNGAPVPEGSTVVFVKRGGGSGVTGNATTDASGKYQLSMRSGPDILVGSYTVGVAPPAQASTMSPDEMMNQQMEEEANKKLSSKPEVADAADLGIPQKFMAPETSGLFFEIKSGENTVDITLAD